MSTISYLFCLLVSVGATLLWLFFWWSSRRTYKATLLMRRDIDKALFRTRKHLTELALRHYYKENMESLQAMRRDRPKRSDINWILFAIHTHGELIEDNEIVYREVDIIELFKTLGFETNWEEENSTNSKKN